MFPREAFTDYLTAIHHDLQAADKQWNLRGFVDVARRVYSLTSDTKVISKALELMLTPLVTTFFERHGFQVILAAEQNQYPDFTLVRDDETYAIDLKSCYRDPTLSTRVSSFTLGAFTGYFRQRASSKNIVFPYARYTQHYVLGVIYTEPTQALKHELRRLDAQLARYPSNPPEDLLARATELRERLTADLKSTIYPLGALAQIPSAIHDIEVIFHEKWRLASDQPGSGNTKNIGSVDTIEALRTGSGIFTRLGASGEGIFNDYWTNYLTRDMARAAELPQLPYRNLPSYLAYRGLDELLPLVERTRRRRSS
jgi:hypothetical protein